MVRVDMMISTSIAALVGCAQPRAATLTAMRLCQTTNRRWGTLVNVSMTIRTYLIALIHPRLRA
jgi:hypothetical protein